MRRNVFAILNISAIAIEAKEGKRLTTSVILVLMLDTPIIMTLVCLENGGRLRIL